MKIEYYLVIGMNCEAIKEYDSRRFTYGNELISIQADSEEELLKMYDNLRELLKSHGYVNRVRPSEKNSKV